MGIFDWLRRAGHAGGEQDSRHIEEAAERILKLNPQLRLARHYRTHLEPALATSLGYVGDIVAGLPEPREASPAAWSGDPYMHAFFATPDDIPQAISRSTDLRAFFEQNAEASEAYAVLGMEMTERHVLGIALEGETMRRDVAQTTVSFSDHQVRMCGRSLPDLKDEIVRRLVDQLGLEGLARIAADKSRRGMLEQERALLKTRLQLLERQGVGVRSVLGGEAEAESGELAALQAQVVQNERDLDSLGIRSEALERELDRLCEVLSDPAQHLYVSSKRYQLDRMNVVQPESNAQAGTDLTFQIARIPTTPPRMRAFTVVRFARADLLPARSLLDEAARLLI